MRGQAGYQPVSYTHLDVYKRQTLTSDTVVTKGTDHESSSVSHLAEGSVVRLVLDGTTVVSIDILE